MSVKLYNLSGLPDEPMRSILVRAKRLAGCGGDVIVKVTRGGYRTTSYASKCDWVKRWFLSPHRRTKASRNLLKGRVNTDGGYVLMQPYHPSEWALRNPEYSAAYKNPINWAQRFFQTAIHEFYHVSEYQSGASHILPWSHRRARPSGATYDAMEKVRCDACGRYFCLSHREVVDGLELCPPCAINIRRNRAAIDNNLITLAIQMEERWGKVAK